MLLGYLEYPLHCRKMTETRRERALSAWRTKKQTSISTQPHLHHNKHSQFQFCNFWTVWSKENFFFTGREAKREEVLRNRRLLRIIIIMTFISRGGCCGSRRLLLFRNHRRTCNHLETTTTTVLLPIISSTSTTIRSASFWHSPQRPDIIVSSPPSPFCGGSNHSFSTTSSSKFSNADWEIVQHFASKHVTKISLQKLMESGQGELLEKTYKAELMGRMGQRLATERILMQVAGFLRHELPIRLAHRIEDLDQVPMMRDMPSVQAVKATYINSLLELVDFEEHITNPTLEADFSKLLQALYQNHSTVLLQMAQGAYELHQRLRQGKQIKGHSPSSDGVVFSELESCHNFLDRFYMSRVGIRTLAGQYLALREQKMALLEAEGGYGRPAPSIHDQHRYVGMICLDTSPLEIVQQAADHASELCIQNYGQAPEVIIDGRLDLTFPYFPTHLHYMLLELLKNALRATMEHHQKTEAEAASNSTGHSFFTDMESDPPPVRVIIADGTENEDVIIKIMDEGGGIPRSEVDKIWSYLFTTAGPDVQDSVIGGEQDQPKFNTSSPIAGLGFGLPMSRAYARYFGGDLDVISMEGYGTDAFLYLARLGYKEPLPV